jgi:F0F1-type ATP synthase assembly protein I
MKKTAAHSATSINKTNNSQTITTMQLGQNYLATGFRIIVPVVLMVFVGAIGDSILRTKPWMTLIGLLIGFMLASMLVKRQNPDSEAAAKK